MSTVPKESWLPPLPREHGAWFILAGSALIGPALTGRFGAGHAALLLGSYGALIGRSALRGPRTIDRAWAAFLLGFAVVINVAIFLWAPSPMLLGAGAATVVLATAQLVLERLKLQRHLAAEILGIGLLTALGPASLALSGLGVDLPTLGIVAANSLYFLTTVPYVRVRVFAPKVPEVWKDMRFDALALSAAGAVVMGVSIGPLGAAPFAVELGRALRLAWAPPRPPKSVSGLGYAEVGSTVFYVVALALVARW